MTMETEKAEMNEEASRAIGQNGQQPNLPCGNGYGPRAGMLCARTRGCDITVYFSATPNEGAPGRLFRVMSDSFSHIVFSYNSRIIL
jgi:hypothetical protein